MYVCVYVCMSVCIDACMYTCRHLHNTVWKYTATHTSAHTCARTVCTRAHVCTLTRTCVGICTHNCTHTHPYVLRRTGQAATACVCMYMCKQNVHVRVSVFAHSNMASHAAPPLHPPMLPAGSFVRPSLVLPTHRTHAFSPSQRIRQVDAPYSPARTPFSRSTKALAPCATSRTGADPPSPPLPRPARARVFFGRRNKCIYIYTHAHTRSARPVRRGARRALAGGASASPRRPMRRMSEQPKGGGIASADDTPRKDHDSTKKITIPRFHDSTKRR